MSILLPFRCGQFALATSGATQDFTIAGESRTPVAALFQWSGATVVATQTNHAVASWGACDGTREWYGSIMSETGVSASDSYTAHNTDAVIVHLDGTGAIDGQLSFNSFISGGVRLDHDDNPGAAYIGQIWFFFEGSYRADTFTTGSTIGVATSVTTTGVVPTFLVLQEFGPQAFSSTVQNSASWSLGFAADDGSSDLQAGAQWVDQDAQATTSAGAITDNATASGFLTSPGLASATVSYAFTASGFDATPQLQMLAHNVGYLAGDIPGLTPWAGHITFPTGAGSQDITDPGVERPVGLICNTALTSEVLATGGATEGIGCGMFDSLSQFSLNMQTDDNRNAGVSNTLTRCFVSDTQMTIVHAPPGTILLAGTWTGSHANGFTINVTTNPAATRLMPVLLWEPSAGTASVDETVEIAEDPRLVVFTHEFETADVVEIVEDPRLVVFTHEFATEDALEIVEGCHIALFSTQTVSERAQAARSGMEAGQGGRSGMQRGQGRAGQ